MSTPPPDANQQYSRTDRGLPGPFGRSIPASSVFAGLGGLVLLVAEFTPLYTVTTATSAAPVSSVTTGSEHGWALIPLAFIALLTAAAYQRGRLRVALPAMLLLGVAALLITLVGDLPAARAIGLLRVAGGGYELGHAGPAVGLYLESLGSVLVLAAGLGGLLLADRPPAGGRGAAARP